MYTEDKKLFQPAASIGQVCRQFTAAPPPKDMMLLRPEQPQLIGTSSGCHTLAENMSHEKHFRAFRRGLVSHFRRFLLGTSMMFSRSGRDVECGLWCLYSVDGHSLTVHSLSITTIQHIFASFPHRSGRILCHLIGSVLMSDRPTPSITGRAHNAAPTVNAADEDVQPPGWAQTHPSRSSADRTGWSL